MPEHEFWCTTPRYFFKRFEQWQNHSNEAWEQARMISFWVVKTVDSKNKFRLYSDLIEFSWDEKAEITPQSEEERQQFSEEADKVFAELYPEAYAKILEAQKAQQNGNNSGS